MFFHCFVLLIMQGGTYFTLYAQTFALPAAGRKKTRTAEPLSAGAGVGPQVSVALLYQTQDNWIVLNKQVADDEISTFITHFSLLLITMHDIDHHRLLS